LLTENHQSPKEAQMHVHHLPKRLARAVAAPRFAAGVVVTLALLSAACSNDSVSRISAPTLNSASAVAFAKTSAITAPPFSVALASFAALGGTGVTCTAPNPPLGAAVTVSGGDVGSGTVIGSVTGFPSLCSLDAGRTPLSGQTGAISDLITAYNALRDDNPCPSAASHNLVGSVGLNHGLQGAVLEPGVYCISGVGLLTSRLTLNGGANAIWIFKAASSITPIGGSVVMAGGASACNVYWQVTSAVDLKNTAFVGNVLAGTAISFTGAAPPATGSSLAGRALAQSLVSMTGANITACTAGKGHKGHKGHKGDKDDKDHKGDKGDKGDKDRGGDHGDGRGGHDGGDHKDGGGGHNS